MTTSEIASSATAGLGLKRQVLGIGLVVLSTIAIAIVPSLAKLAYEGGSNTLSVITGRSIFSVFMTFLLLIVLRQPIVIGWKPLRNSLCTGVGYAVILYGYLGAVNYLPVNQVILIYFIHPLLVGSIAMYRGQERLTLLSTGTLVAALVGLWFALGSSFENLDTLGIGLAVIAMVATSIVILANARAMADAPAISVGFFMMVSAAAVLAMLFAIFGDLVLPTTTLGWTGFIGVAVAATTGTLAFLSGMAQIGATRATMITNLEPILGVLFAINVLGEQVSVYQGLGIAVVIAAIFANEWRG
jgi:drug/metabolite transporter (DMT)-like permease